MGIADFYLTVVFKKNNYAVFEKVYQLFAAEEIFRILDKEETLNHLSLECKFDNLIPSIIIAFNILYPLEKNIESIETNSIVKEFTFTCVDELLNYVFNANKIKLLGYYTQLGYFSINSKNYYKIRIKLKKYFKKLE